PSGISARNWYRWFGVRFDVRLDDAHPVKLDVVLRTPDAVEQFSPPPVSDDASKGVVAQMLLRGAGWHTVFLPWSSFDFPQAFAGFLTDIKELALVAKYEDGEPGSIALRKP